MKSVLIVQGPVTAVRGRNMLASSRWGLALGVLAFAVMSRTALAGPCKADGEACRTSRSCCGTSGNNGVCVRESGERFGLCCTQTGNDTNCDGRDDDCDGVADDGYVPTATTCGTGECASTGTTVCEGGSLGDTCNPAATNGTGCTDGNECTEADLCQDGTCTGMPIAGCCRDNNDCTPPEICMGGTCTSCGDGVVSGDEICDPPGEVGCSPDNGGCNVTVCEEGCQTVRIRSCLDGSCAECAAGLGVTCPG